MPRVLNRRVDPGDERAVYIGRPSKWGNPFTHLQVRGTLAKFSVPTREAAIAAYEQWLDTQPHLLAALPELHGRDLVCCCSPKACHGDVLLRRANQ